VLENKETTAVEFLLDPLASLGVGFVPALGNHVLHIRSVFNCNEANDYNTMTMSFNTRRWRKVSFLDRSQSDRAKYFNVEQAPKASITTYSYLIGYLLTWPAITNNKKTKYCFRLS
jgi:hypothetical protein